MNGKNAVLSRTTTFKNSVHCKAPHLMSSQQPSREPISPNYAFAGHEPPRTSCTLGISVFCMHL
jgi:hypothetical protein